MTSNSKQVELELQGYKYVVFVDEAGYGSVAGSMFVTAVYVPSKAELVKEVKDSKMITTMQKRQKVYQQVANIQGLQFETVEVSAVEIDQVNVFEARRHAMYEAVRRLGQKVAVDYVVVDGNYLPPALALVYPCEAIIKADSTCYGASIAGIISKYRKDLDVIELAKQHPKYSFLKHSGYATKNHLNELSQHGVIPRVHRRSYKCCWAEN